jgi:DNA-binding response OmpR family regulator
MTHRWPVSRAMLVEQVWKLDCESMPNVVDVYINYLRRKIDSGYDFKLIRTIRGVGYQIGAHVLSPVKNVVCAQCRKRDLSFCT